MLKNFIVLILAICLLCSATNSAQALLVVKTFGASYNLNWISAPGGYEFRGYGLSFEWPHLLPPLFTTLRLEAIIFPLASFYGIFADGSYKLTKLPVYTGLGVGFISGGSRSLPVPIGLNFNAYVGYDQLLLSKVHLFIQGNYGIVAVIGPAYLTGTSLKGGFRFGF